MAAKAANLNSLPTPRSIKKIAQLLSELDVVARESEVRPINVIMGPRG